MEDIEVYSMDFKCFLTIVMPSDLFIMTVPGGSFELKRAKENQVLGSSANCGQSFPVTFLSMRDWREKRNHPYIFCGSP